MSEEKKNQYPEKSKLEEFFGRLEAELGCEDVLFSQCPFKAQLEVLKYQYEHLEQEYRALQQDFTEDQAKIKRLQYLEELLAHQLMERSREVKILKEEIANGVAQEKFEYEEHLKNCDVCRLSKKE